MKKKVKKKKASKRRSPKSSIPVYCSYTKLVPIAELTPNPRNPNKHPDNQIVALAKVIRANGWRRSIVVSKRSGFIVSGHARLLAGMKLKEEFLPVDFQDYVNEAAEFADLLADNKIAELAEIDFKASAELLRDIPAEDRFAAGYFDHEVAPMLSALEADEEPPKKEPAGPVEPGTHFRATQDQAEIIRKAIDHVKMNDKPSMSDGRALELICADYLA